MTTALQILRKINACDESVEWVLKQNTDDPSVLWETCSYGDWINFLLSKIGYDMKKLEQAYKVCFDTCDTSYKVRNRTCEAAYVIRNNTGDVTWGAAYDICCDTCDAADKVYHETHRAALKQFADDIRKIVSFEEVMELLAKI